MRRLSVGMGVMRIRIMRVNMLQRRMAMPMAVPRPRRHGRHVRMPMMRVAEAVDVLMGMRDGLVAMQMGMTLGEMQRHAHRHQSAAHQQGRGDRIIQQHHSQYRADERRH